MRLISNDKVINIMEQTLNHVDTRLVNHGRRVAYLMFKVLYGNSKFTHEELHNVCLLGLLHDVGAYKTEEIDRMVEFETEDTWGHSIYGYLFLKYFSPLKTLASVLLFHHADCHEARFLIDPTQRFLANLISLCDRADIFILHKGSSDEFVEYITKGRGTKYDSDVVDAYIESGVNLDIVFNDLMQDKLFMNVLYSVDLSDEDALAYLRMIVSFMDFRSHYTVLHTVSTTCIAVLLARMLGLDENVIIDVKTGAMLHDIGKVGVPVSILESKSQLAPHEFDIIKKHVGKTADIIIGSVKSEISDIAVKHHEKLNGSGYPDNRQAYNIPVTSRIVAVADIFSALREERSYKTPYPKDKICSILRKMADEKHIDSDIVDLAIANYDLILDEIAKEVRPVLEVYDTIKADLARLHSAVANGMNPLD